MKRNKHGHSTNLKNGAKTLARSETFPGDKHLFRAPLPGQYTDDTWTKGQLSKAAEDASLPNGGAQVPPTTAQGPVETPPLPAKAKTEITDIRGEGWGSFHDSNLKI